MHINVRKHHLRVMKILALGYLWNQNKVKVIKNQQKIDGLYCHGEHRCRREKTIILSLRIKMTIHTKV